MLSNPSTSSSVTDVQLSRSPPTPALYCEPEPRDFGQRFFGNRGFGGLLEDLDRPNSDGTTRWIPQYNLQNFWRRRIPPFKSGLIEPLIPPRTRSSRDFDRLPGHFSFRSSEYELYNRNLLTTRFFNQIYSDDEEIFGVLKIWTVNERSKRRRLECFSVEINSQGIPVDESLQSFSNFKLKMRPPVKNEARPPKAKEPLLELRTSIWSPESYTRLFLRSPTLLQMIQLPEDHSEDEDEEVVFRKHIPIFNTAVKSFTESHLLEGTLALVDYGGRVWIHDISSSSPETAQKLNANDQEVYQYATFCDHPKMMAVAGNYHVETVDMRCLGGSRACSELWRSPLFSTRGYKEGLYVQCIPPVSAMVRHISRVPGTANNYLVMTDRTLHLLDDRFPGRTVLGVKHPFSTGTHRMVVSEKLKDVVDDGNIYSIFCLDQLQAFKSSISMAKIYVHPSGVWSSVDAFHAVGEPENFNQIIHRGKYTEPNIIAEPTRAMTLVEHQNMKSSLLLRQTDDGAIWWQKFSNDDVPEKTRVEEERKSFERIVEKRKSDPDVWIREEWRPVYSDGMSEEVKENPKDSRQIVHIGVPSLDRRTISKFHNRAINLQRQFKQFHVTSPSTLLEVIPLDDENSTISKIVLETFQATENMMTENSSLLDDFYSPHS